MESESESYSLEIGTIVGKSYRILQLLDASEESAIYLAHHIVRNQNVWLKMLSPNATNDHYRAQKFQLEARALSKFEHKNVIKMYDFGLAESGVPYFSTEALQGINLRTLLGEKGSLDFNLALPIFAQICDGLQAAHNASVVHRQLRPESIFLLDIDVAEQKPASKDDYSDDLVKIVEFESCKLLAREQDRLKGLQQVAVTVRDSPTCYYSPEQILARDLDARADVYCMGNLIYEALMGKAAFSGEAIKRILREHEFLRPESFLQRRPDLTLPEGLQAVVFKAMEQDPADRYQTMDELKNALIFTIGGDSADKMNSLFSAALSWLSKKKKI